MQEEHALSRGSTGLIVINDSILAEGKARHDVTNLERTLANSSARGAQVAEMLGRMFTRALSEFT